MDEKKPTTIDHRPIPSGAKLLPDEAKKVFQGEIFAVYQWPQTLFDGSMATFEMLQRPDTVIIIPVKENGKLWVLHEEQPGYEVRDLYLPGGRVDPGEVVLDAAKRECEEEIGVRFRTWLYLGGVQPQKKIDWIVHTFIAIEPYEIVPVRHDAGEKIDIGEATYEQFRTESDEAGRLPHIRDCETLDDLINKARPV